MMENAWMMRTKVLWKTMKTMAKKKKHNKLKLKFNILSHQKISTKTNGPKNLKDTIQIM